MFWCDVVMFCCDVVLWCSVVCDGVWDVVCDGVSGGECCGKVEWLILSCLGILVTDRRTLVVVESLSQLNIVKRNLKIDCTICRIQSTINTQDNWNGWNSSRKDFIQKTVKEISDLLTSFFCNVTYNILSKISILFPASRLMYNRLQITFLGKFKLFGLWFVLPRIYHLLLM